MSWRTMVLNFVRFILSAGILAGIPATVLGTLCLITIRMECGDSKYQWPLMSDVTREAYMRNYSADEVNLEARKTLGSPDNPAHHYSAGNPGLIVFGWQNDTLRSPGLEDTLRHAVNFLGKIPLRAVPQKTWADFVNTNVRRVVFSDVKSGHSMSTTADSIVFVHSADFRHTIAKSAYPVAYAAAILVHETGHIQMAKDAGAAVASAINTSQIESERFANFYMFHFFDDLHAAYPELDLSRERGQATLYTLRMSFIEYKLDIIRRCLIAAVGGWMISVISGACLFLMVWHKP